MQWKYELRINKMDLLWIWLWDILVLWTLEPLDLQTQGMSIFLPLPSSTTSSYFFLPPSSWFGLVWGGGCQMTSEFICEEILILFHSSSNLLPPPSYSSQLLHPPPKPLPNSSYLLPKCLRWLMSSYMKRFQWYSAQKSFMGGWHCNYSFKLQVQVS